MPYSTWSWRRWTVIEQILMKEIMLAHFQSLFERSNRDAFWENESKIHEGRCVKEFFHKLAGEHLATSLQINFFTDNLQVLQYCKWTPSKGYFSFFYKMPESTCEMYVLYVLVEILQLVHEISSSSGFTYKRAILKNFSNFTDKHDKKSSAGILSKNVFKNFAKLRERYLRRNLFFNKVTGWKPKTIRSSHWRCSVKRYY